MFGLEHRRLRVVARTASGEEGVEVAVTARAVPVVLPARRRRALAVRVAPEGVDHRKRCPHHIDEARPLVDQVDRPRVGLQDRRELEARIRAGDDPGRRGLALPHRHRVTPQQRRSLPLDSLACRIPDGVAARFLGTDRKSGRRADPEPAEPGIEGSNAVRVAWADAEVRDAGEVTRPLAGAPL